MITVQFLCVCSHIVNMHCTFKFNIVPILMLNNLENTLKLVFIDNLDMFFIDEVYARCINGDTLPTGGI